MPFFASLLKKHDKFAKLAEKCEFLPQVVSRLVIGVVFIPTGWGKLHDLKGVAENFAGWGIPFPTIQAPIAAASEFLFGICVLLGLFTRLSTIPLMVIMVVAMVKVTGTGLPPISEPLKFADGLTSISEFLWLMLLLWLLVRGPGVLSLDRLLVALRPKGGSKGEGGGDKPKKKD